MTLDFVDRRPVVCVCARVRLIYPSLINVTNNGRS